MNLFEENNRMKDMMGLNESKQVGPLYHFTDVDAAIGILYSNTLKGSMANVGDDKRGDKVIKKNSISFTRHKSFVGGSPVISIQSLSVRLEIDGDKLSRHYKIQPYNHFNQSKIKGFATTKFLAEMFVPPQSQNEFEERVYADQIKNIKAYIVGITLDVSREEQNRTLRMNSDPDVEPAMAWQEMMDDIDKLKSMYPDIKLIKTIEVDRERHKFEPLNESFHKSVRDSNGGYIIEYKHNGDVIGAIRGGVWKNYLTVEHIYLIDEYRSQGHSLQFYKDALELAKSKGLEGLMVGGQLLQANKSRNTYKHFVHHETEIKNEHGEPYVILTDFIG